MEWTIQSISAKGPGKEKFHLQDEQDMINLLETYFPKYDNELSTLPHLSHIRRNYFFAGQLVKQKKHKKTGETGEIPKLVETKDDAYDGEIMQVLRCLGEIETLTGLAFHSFNQISASQTFSNISKNFNFEIDWILVNNAGIFVIEVGLASDTSNPKPIIDSKVDQIIRRTSEVFSRVVKAADKAHLLENEVNYVVALPNVSIVDVESWIKDDDNRTQLENFESDIWFFTQETLIQHKVFKMSRKDMSLGTTDLTELFSSQSQHQSDVKFVASLIMHGKLSTRQTLKTIPKPKPCERDAAFEKLGNFEYPEDIVLSPEQQSILRDIISGNNQTSLLFGDAGSGKTTVLLLLLLFYAGKTVANKCFIGFYIPEEKWAFTSEMERFIDESCDQNFIEIIHDKEQLKQMLSCEHARSKSMGKQPFILLVDEIYGTALYDWYEQVFGHIVYLESLYTNRVRLIASIVTSGVEWIIGINSRLRLREDYVNYFLTLSFRNSLHISRPAAKIKRSINANDKSEISYLTNARHFATFYSTTAKLTVSFKIHKENETVNQKLILIYGNEVRLNTDPKSTVVRIAPELDVQYFGFTGIEADTVAIVLQPELFWRGTVSRKQKLFLYNALTRARLDVVILSSVEIIKLVKLELGINEQDRMLEMIQEGKTLRKEVLEDWDKKFDKFQKMNLLVLVAMSGNLQLVENLLYHLKYRPSEHDNVLASILSYSFFQQIVSPKFFKFIDGLGKLFRFNRYIHESVVHPAFLGAFIHYEFVQCYHSWMQLQQFRELVRKKTLSADILLLSASFYGLKDSVQFALQEKYLNSQFLMRCFICGVARNNDYLVETLLPKLKILKASELCMILAEVCFIFQNQSAAFSEETNSRDIRFQILDVIYDLLSDPQFEKDGNTLLHISCHCSNTYFVGKVIEGNSALLASKNNKFQTPLDFAFYFMNLDIVFFLVENFWEELSEVDLYYPLSFILAALGLIEKLKSLQSEQPEQLYKKTRDGFNIMHAICMYGRVEVLEFILSEHPQLASLKTPTNLPSPIAKACEFGHLAIVERLLNFDRDLLNARSGIENFIVMHLALVAAACGGFTKIAECLLAKYEPSELITSLADIDWMIDTLGWTPLNYACGNNKVEMVKCLCEWKPEMLNKEILLNAIRVASKNAQASIFLYLVAKLTNIMGKKVSENTFSPPFFRLICGQRGRLTTIVGFHKAYNQYLLRGCGLIESSMQGRLEVVKYLLLNDPTSPDFHLHCQILKSFLAASKKRQWHVVRYFASYYHSLLRTHWFRKNKAVSPTKVICLTGVYSQFCLLNRLLFTSSPPLLNSMSMFMTLGTIAIVNRFYHPLKALRRFLPP